MRPRSRYHDCGGCRARPHPLDRAVGERDRRETGRHAEALLRARVDGVDPPAVDLDGDAAERRDRVDEQQRVGVAAARASGATSFSTPVDVSACTTATSRAPGFAALRVEQPLRVDRAAPRLVDAHDLGAAALRDVAHALAEHAVDADDHGVARLDEVDEARLHARPSRCR